MFLTNLSGIIFSVLPPQLDEREVQCPLVDTHWLVQPEGLGARERSKRVAAKTCPICSTLPAKNYITLPCSGEIPVPQPEVMETQRIQWYRETISGDMPFMPPLKVCLELLTRLAPLCPLRAPGPSFRHHVSFCLLTLLLLLSDCELLEAVNGPH